jgi:hypothetical protein
MADLPEDLQDVHTILAMCGITTPAIRTLFMNLEGFDTLSAFGILVDDNDVTSMAARMSRRTVAEGKFILLGTTVIECLQTLIWWIRDQKKQSLPLSMAANFNADMLKETAALKLFRSEQANREPPVTALMIFHPDDFDTHEDAFLNL